jgi:hypothetical protein
MRAVAAALVILVSMVSLAIDPAAAYETWCADDPVVAIEGRLLDIQVQMPVSSVASMRSTTLTVIIPQNAAGHVVVDDISAFPMKTTVVARGPKWGRAGPVPVTIVVEVTAATSYPIRVTATPLLNLATVLTAPETAAGTANTRIELKLALGG